MKSGGTHLRNAEGASVPLRLRGRPTLLTAKLKLPPRALENQACRVSLPEVLDEPLTVRPLIGRDIQTPLLRFRLPRLTPPGTYRGTVEVGERQIPIVVEVEPRFQLRMQPADLRLQSRPGAKVSVALEMQNLGNLPFLVESKYTFCLFDASGIDRAFFVALAEAAPEGKRRIDRFMDELAQSHGGLVRVIIEAGAGGIAPGETRELRVDLHFSDRLQPKHIYSGSWSLADFRYFIQVEAIDGPSAKEKSR